MSEQKKRKVWFSVCAKPDLQDYREKNNLILPKAKELKIEVYSYIGGGEEFLYAHCTSEEMEQLITVLGKDDYFFKKISRLLISFMTHGQLAPVFPFFKR